MTTSLENEWLSAELLREYGLPVAACAVQRFGATRALVVTRFDRALHSSGRYWLRLPQEDAREITELFRNLCQEYDTALPDAEEMLRAMLRLTLLRLARLYVQASPEFLETLPLAIAVN